MRLAFFSDNFYPEISGISDSIILIAKEFARLGHQVCFYVPKYSKKDFQVACLEPKELDLGPNIEIVRLPSLPYLFSPTRQSRFVLPFGFSFKHLRKFRPDLIHTHSPFGAGLEALLASRILKIKLIGTNHTPITEFLRYGFLQLNFIKKVSLAFFSWYYNRCCFVSTPSYDLLNEMKNNKFIKEAQVLPNPVDIVDFVPATVQEKEKLKKKFKLSNFVVLYTGRLAEEKHIDVIIKSIALVKEKIPEVNMAITGYGGANKILHNLVGQLGLVNQVKFFGRLNDDVYSQIYRASDVFAIMSTAETQSLSLMKAMGSGLPVIGAESRALPEYINSTNGILVPPGDSVCLAEKIIYLYNNVEMSKNLGNGGKNYIKNFSVKKITEDWLKNYKDCLKK